MDSTHEAYSLTNNRIVSVPLCVSTSPSLGSLPLPPRVTVGVVPAVCAGQASTPSFVGLASSLAPRVDGLGATQGVSFVHPPARQVGLGASPGVSGILPPARVDVYETNLLQAQYILDYKGRD